MLEMNMTLQNKPQWAREAEFTRHLLANMPQFAPDFHPPRKSP
jgi:hypothetical protein